MSGVNTKVFKIITPDKVEHKQPAGRSEPLVSLRPHFVGITLNYSPKFMFRHNKKSVQWGCLDPDTQKNIFEKHIDDVYKHHFQNIHYVFEFTKAMQLHAHCIGMIMINPEHKDYHLTKIQKLVGLHPEVQRYTKGKYGTYIQSNYIHYVDKDIWTKYMSKDLNKIPYKKRSITDYIQEKTL